jgi:hypothetical protein
MLDDLAGRRTGERIQILRERKGLSRPVLAGLVGMSASWLRGIGQGGRVPPRLPVLVKLAETLAVGVAVLAGTGMESWWRCVSTGGVVRTDSARCRACDPGCGMGSDAVLAGHASSRTSGTAGRL